MKANTFVMFGSVRSFWIFYQGMGLAVTVLLTLEAVLFWLLGDLAKTGGIRLRSVLLALVIGEVALITVSWNYFFPGPALAGLPVLGCLVVAAVGLGNRVSRSTSQVVSS